MSFLPGNSLSFITCVYFKCFIGSTFITFCGKCWLDFEPNHVLFSFKSGDFPLLVIFSSWIVLLMLFYWKLYKIAFLSFVFYRLTLSLQERKTFCHALLNLMRIITILLKIQFPPIKASCCCWSCHTVDVTLLLFNTVSSFIC